MDSKQLFFAYAIGIALVAGYVAFGVWAIRKSWTWSASVPARWLRVLLVSTVVTMLFAPGLAGGGHGVGVVPAWLMFATGTFGALTGASKQAYLLSIAIAWAVVFVVTWLVTDNRQRK